MATVNGDAAPVAQSTAYVAMLPFAYTTNDVAQLFAPFGKLARVLVLRDKQTRRSRGVAFVQFTKAEDCARAVAQMDKATVEGLTLACSLCRDNGRAREFAKKRKYSSASRCFECGEHGHVSYACPRNVLGARERPASTSKRSKLKKKKKFDPHERADFFNDQGTTNLLAPPADSEPDVSLSLLAYPLTGSLESEPRGSSGNNNAPFPSNPRRIRRPASYFSDEDPSDEEGERGI